MLDNMTDFTLLMVMSGRWGLRGQKYGVCCLLQVSLLSVKTRKTVFKST